jgi:1L-myo-inositol 1-phosphate cytidylyltransferase
VLRQRHVPVSAPFLRRYAARPPSAALLLPGDERTVKGDAEGAGASTAATAATIIESLLHPLPAVILAAGLGSRLRAVQPDLPKSLVPVLGRPLLSYTLDGLARAGVREAHVVVGHRGKQVRAALLRMVDSLGSEMRIATVENQRFRLPNGSSLAAAREAVAGRPFILLMADHLLGDEAIGRMLRAPHGYAIGVDRGPMPPSRLLDATRVQLGADGLVRAFGKQLAAWDAIDTGIFRCLPGVFDAIDALGPGAEVSRIMTAVAAHEPFHAVDLTGAFWLDVDTPDDLAEAEQLLRHA